MNILQHSIESIVSNISTIAPSQNFWLNRTNAGEYYETFLEKEFIGLDIDLLQLSEIAKIRELSIGKKSRPDYNYAQHELINLVYSKNDRKIREAHGTDKTRIKTELTRQANQVFNFTFNMKKGDYVIIPSESSKYVSIGTLTQPFLGTEEQFRLERKVNWIGQFKRESLDPNFFKLFFSHQALSNINNYRDIVLRTLYDFYFDSEEGHLVFNIKSMEKINALNESAFGFYLLQLLSGYFIKYDLPYTVTDINTIVNLNSPGKKKFFGPKTTIFMVGCLLLMTIGGGVEYKKGSFSATTNGVLESIDDYLRGKQERELVEKIMENADSLDIEERNEYLLRVLRELKDKEE
ncbi:hypothetical protein [Reichenbachiella agariperforans]|uniref:hypothetical protein n=1 Tax=Reichenbachiella agariperforans TaxID=156994 RepID=UPI001C0A10FC|nr:hypothetical protein [Reichenbachiella agariperforans]MBU2915363.1 hypothetical protein [Reichenbachiella agariperforans]